MMNLMATFFFDAICSNVRVDSVGVSSGVSAGRLLDIFFSSLERVGDLEFVFLLDPRTGSLSSRVGVKPGTSRRGENRFGFTRGKGSDPRSDRSNVLGGSSYS